MVFSNNVSFMMISCLHFYLLSKMTRKCAGCGVSKLIKRLLKIKSIVLKYLSVCLGIRAF